MKKLTEKDLPKLNEIQEELGVNLLLLFKAWKKETVFADIDKKQDDRFYWNCHHYPNEYPGIYMHIKKCDDGVRRYFISPYRIDTDKYELKDYGKTWRLSSKVVKEK